MKEHNGLNVFPPLYFETSSQWARLYSSVPYKLQIIRGEINKLSKELVFLSKRMDSADPTVDDIRVSLDLLNQRSVCFSDEADNRLERPTSPAMDHKMDIQTAVRGPFNWKSI